MTLILKLDPNMVKMYLHQNEFGYVKQLHPEGTSKNLTFVELSKDCDLGFIMVRTFLFSFFKHPSEINK